MIGVYANSADPRFVAELFELFKTPWERAVPGRRYRAVISNDANIGQLDADVILVFSAANAPAAGVIQSVRAEARASLVSWHGATFPVYGAISTFGPATESSVLTIGPLAVDLRERSGAATVWRVGFDLFGEVGRLLTQGQPADHARVATLDLQIGLVRSLLLDSGVSLIEIPPRPFGSDFICCLTHDVDFFGITRHKADRTLAGFLLRASIGGLADLVRGRRSLGEVVRNIRAMLSLPLVFLGMTRDFWQPFEDYRQVEDGDSSTFFLVPFRGRPGLGLAGKADGTRAVPYQISEIRQEALEAMSQGSELAVHGVDAWCDAAAGRDELAELTSVTGLATAGVRMHWLYFAEESPRYLEAAGFDYDSSWGFNETIGYRAGTAQVFRLPDTDDLMELPLTIMDSAMFSARRMGLGPADAAALYEPIVNNAKRDGGAVVINWHERSLAPERLWGRSYDALRSYVARGNKVWFTTAGNAVDWFRWRRAVRFESDGGVIRISAPETRLPEGVLRIARTTPEGVAFEDMKLGTGTTSINIDTLTTQTAPLSTAVN
jgi:hypothetical protein